MASITSSAVVAMDVMSASAARPARAWSVAPSTAASSGSSPCASSAPTMPASTSPSRPSQAPAYPRPCARSALHRIQTSPDPSLRRSRRRRVRSRGQVRHDRPWVNQGLRKPCGFAGVGRDHRWPSVDKPPSEQPSSLRRRKRLQRATVDEHGSSRMFEHQMNQRRAFLVVGIEAATHNARGRMTVPRDGKVGGGQTFERPHDERWAARAHKILRFGRRGDTRVSCARPLTGRSRKTGRTRILSAPHHREQHASRVLVCLALRKRQKRRQLVRRV